MVNVIKSQKLSGVQRGSGGGRACGGVAVNARRAGAGSKRRASSTSSTQTRRPTGRSKVANKRSRQTPVQTPVVPAPFENAVGDGHLPEDEPEDGAVKTEWITASEACTEAFPVGAVAGERVTPEEQGSGAEQDGVVKTEEGILFP